MFKRVYVMYVYQNIDLQGENIASVTTLWLLKSNKTADYVWKSTVATLTALTLVVSKWVELSYNHSGQC